MIRASRITGSRGTMINSRFSAARDKNNNKMLSPDRRNDYDVTNTVQVSDPVAVRSAVRTLFARTFPGHSFDSLWLAFYDFERLFGGDYPGYFGCDTTYHDQQHTLDMSLAVARLIAGYERSARPIRSSGCRARADGDHRRVVP